MRILMVIRPAVGGMKRQVLDLSGGIQADGHHVEIAAPAGSDVADAARELGFVVHDIPLVGALNPLVDVRAIRALTAIVCEGRFDVVHAHGFKAGLVSRFAARRGRAGTCVVTVHNPVLTRTDTPALARRAYRTLERTFQGLVARYIALELTDDFGLPAEKITTVYGSIDAAPFLEPQERTAAREALGVEPNARVVGFAARLSDQKGVDTLLRATVRLVADDPQLRLVIGGSGPLEGTARELSAALGNGANVVWHGWVEDMPAFLAGLDVFASPALTEAFGLALLEVGAAGVPVVATRVGGVPEVILDGRTGLLVEPSNPDALADAILALLHNPDLARRLATAARERVLTEFTLSKTVTGTLAVYSAALTSTSMACSQGAL